MAHRNSPDSLKGIWYRYLGMVEGEKPYITGERGAHGDLRIAVPAAYQGTIRISYQGFAIFHVAEAVSLVEFIVILGMYLYLHALWLRSRLIEQKEIVG